MEIETTDTGVERTYRIPKNFLSTEYIRLEETLLDFIRTDTRDIVLDLAQVTRIDSMALATILRIKKKLIEVNRGLSIINPTEPVIRLFELSGLETYLL